MSTENMLRKIISMAEIIPQPNTLVDASTLNPAPARRNWNYGGAARVKVYNVLAVEIPLCSSF